MTRPIKLGLAGIITRICIWSVRNQTWLAGQVRIYLFMATGIIAFLGLAGVISIQTALLSSFCFGLIAMGLIWTLIQQRRSWLLNLREPELRDQALSAMLSYINEVQGLGEVRQRTYGLSRNDNDQCTDCHMP